MEDHEKVTDPAQPRPLTEAQTAVGSPSGTTPMGLWKVVWPLVAGGLVIGGGTLIAKRMGKDDPAPRPSYLTTPPTPATEPKIPKPEAAPVPKGGEADPYEDALRPEGTGAFLRYCRDMDEAMNLKGVEELAKKRLARVPDSYLAWAIIGYVHEWRNQHEEARAAYRKAKDLLDRDREMALQPVQARAEMEMICTGKAGIYLFCHGDQDARFATCRKAAMDNPKDDGAWFVLGFTAASRSNFAVMALCADKLEKLNPAKAAQFREACIEPMKAQMRAARRGGTR